MSEDTSTTTEEVSASVDGAEGSTTEAKAAESKVDDKPTDDWQGKYQGQLKVNRDLEKKLKDALGKAEKVADLEATVAKLEGKEAEFAAAQKQREVEQAALAKANERILKAEVKAAAKGVLADPVDALTFLDLSSFEVGDDGSVDTAAITAAIEDLTKNKPYLAAQSGQRFEGTADGGARTSKPAPTVDEQIAEAESAGNWREAQRLKSLKLIELNKNN